MKMWKHTLIGLMSLFTASSFATPVELDNIAVIVNNGVILQSDIDSALLTLNNNAKKNNQSLPSLDVLREQVVEKLIVDAIQYQEAERLGVKIDDNNLNQALVDVAKEREMTPEQLRISLNNDGIDYSTFREQLRKEIAISEARNALVRRRVNILPAEVESLATQLAKETNTSVQYKIQHIQLRFEDNIDKQQLENEAKDIVDKLNAGENFSTMAITHSKGPKALNGGDWGWLRKEEMPTIFADQITTQTAGSIIGPFRSGVGMHILKISDTRGLETVSVTEVNARHILIKPSVILSDEGAKKQLLSFIDQIKSGETTFAKLATQYSQDPGSATQNGELGYQTPDLYVPEFKHQVEILPLHQISEPFKTVHGWHIVEVLDRRNVDKTDTALTNRAYRILFNRKFNEEASAWMQEIRASAFVEVLENEQGEVQ
ncbi:peptidylprolyl isomerase SurA [Vibrio sp. TH_r3]|uniref:peptidylprolyl isomerase SurA n=1 Tax=Vibrio sp. TH_r3 TaxID=3082084 RepID=UPI0029545B23|nr:peptidylprolyl isomerase SurA [Vibrio sp. TH_r3]MDV7105809.1 peptidylprolyl isomerase SurA [Vibrio sp. TH_r3]